MTKPAQNIPLKSIAPNRQPSDQKASGQKLFAQLNQALRHLGQGMPALIIDQASLDANIDHVQQQLPTHLQPRLVVKSLESLNLLSHIAGMLNCQRFMVFHAAHLPLVLEQFPHADILLGKPMPVDALSHFYQQYPQHTRAAIQWLVDSLPRVQQYLTHAIESNLSLNMSIEIDVGLHRGGMQSTQQLDELLQVIEQHPNQLTLSGLMGYDAHVSKIPRIIQSQHAAYQQSQHIYQQYISHIQQHFPSMYRDQLCFNGGGSPTFSLHCQQSVCNDVALGSMLVKPTDFDIATLKTLLPALFIAAPVLKVLPSSQIPGLKVLDKLMLRHKALFVYGGNWMAQYVYPQGARTNLLYGRSSNQEMVNVPKTCPIEVDDFVFLRPTQSEAIISQFACIYVYQHGTLKQWDTFLA